MISVQGPLAAMSPRKGADAPAARTGQEDSFASLVGGRQLSEMPEETTAVKEIAALNVEGVDDAGPPAPAPKDVDEMASPPMPEAPVATSPAPTFSAGMIPLEAAAASVSDASLSMNADEPQAADATLSALEPGVAKAAFVLMDDPVLALPLGDSVGGSGAFEHADAVIERGWTAVAEAEFYGPIEVAGTVAPGSADAADRPAKDRPLLPLADDGAAQPVVSNRQSAEPVPSLQRAEPITRAGAPPLPTGRQASEIGGKRSLATGGVRIERVFARGSVHPTGAVVAPAAPPAQADSVVAAPKTVLSETAQDQTVPKSEPVSATPGPDRAVMEPRLAAPSTAPTETRAEMSFSTTLPHAAHASAAEAPPPPRSPLVQAALDRIFPLPAAAGETVIRLNPHGLGIIEVVLQDGRNGALDVALRVQNPLVLEAMRQERDAVAHTFSAAQGGAAGSLSMDLFQSGTGQRGTAPEVPAGRTPAGEAGQEDPQEDAQPGNPVPQISRADRVNIMT